MNDIYIIPFSPHKNIINDKQKIFNKKKKYIYYGKRIIIKENHIIT